MAICDVCGNFDDEHIEAPTKMFPSTKTTLPDYNINLIFITIGIVNRRGLLLARSFLTSIVCVKFVLT
ncbi:MAG: hypothetical protein CM15mV5_0060 [uncultured marine virus]|nr:MAG: hypothetical protein CM15mV5_0060 [uncultured marine virus]